MDLADDGHLAVVYLLALVHGAVDDVVLLEDAVHLAQRSHPVVALALLLRQHQHLVLRAGRVQH